MPAKTTSEAECKAEPGAFAPAVDRGKCEGKRDCDVVCPYHVFEIRRIDDADFAALSFFGLQADGQGCPGPRHRLPDTASVPVCLPS